MLVSTPVPEPVPRVSTPVPVPVLMLWTLQSRRVPAFWVWVL